MESRPAAGSWPHALALETEISKGISVLSFSHNADEPSRIEFEPHLSPDEKARALKFAFDRDRIGFIVARGMLRRLLGQILQTPASAVRFRYGEAGKPALHESMADKNMAGKDLEFNLSHSGNVVAIAFARGIASVWISSWSGPWTTWTKSPGNIFPGPNLRNSANCRHLRGLRNSSTSGCKRKPLSKAMARDCWCR